MTVAIILHNLVIDVEGIGADALANLQLEHPNGAELQDTGIHGEDEGLVLMTGERKRQMLTAELIAFQNLQN